MSNIVRPSQGKKIKCLVNVFADVGTFCLRSQL